MFNGLRFCFWTQCRSGCADAQHSINKYTTYYCFGGMANFNNRHKELSHFVCVCQVSSQCCCWHCDILLKPNSVGSLRSVCRAKKKHSVNHRLRSRRVFCTVLIFLMFFSQLFIQNPKSCAMTETKVDQCSPSNAQTMISCRPAFANGFFQCKELHGLQSSRLGISR